MRTIYKEVTDKGPGGHILTGPVYVEGAEPGRRARSPHRQNRTDLLVRLQRLPPRLRLPARRLPLRPHEDHPARPRTHGRPLRRSASRSRCIPSSAAWASRRPRSNGRINSGPPWIHAGNIDNKELVAGTTLFIPVHAKGALFEVGDGHAGQGNGEVDITALETALTGTFQFIVRKDMHLKWPRAETPTHYIAMGIHEDLTEATKMAVREAIDFLVTEKHLSRDDAYMLASVAVDFNITQLVDGNKGVHAMIPKAIFKR